MRTRSTVVQADGGVELSYERALLRVQAGPDEGLEHPLSEGPLILGRGEAADLRLSDPAVSREHVRLAPSEQGWRVLDLESRSGTFLSGVRVADAWWPAGAPLRVGDTTLVLEVGSTTLRAQPHGEVRFHDLIGASAPMRELFGLVQKVGPLGLPVLLHGESGTGKEGVARALHAESMVRGGPYEVVDCTLLQGDHLRSELFGHKRGAFTGADADRPGAFVRADGGTLFLDEVAEIPLELQPQLLRVLEEGEVRPLGGSGSQRVRVRVVAASHHDLAARVDEGTFRGDLFYRLSAVTLALPPLRERPDDVRVLAEHFLQGTRPLSEEASEALRRYPWPGNVRELRNVLTRAEALAEGARIEVADLRLPAPSTAGPAAPEAARRRADAPESVAAVDRAVEDEERQRILDALRRAGGNRSKAAKLLGMARSSFYYKLDKLGLTEPE